MTEKSWKIYLSNVMKLTQIPKKLCHLGNYLKIIFSQVLTGQTDCRLLGNISWECLGSVRR